MSPEGVAAARCRSVQGGIPTYSLLPLIGRDPCLPRPNAALCAPRERVLGRIPLRRPCLDLNSL
ncbi:MAG: hypothetical protein MPL62_08890 [Alphaproteobacteria bacterium]|nr:hypothetical protein [Alphaproteobacteria bacterium]